MAEDAERERRAALEREQYMTMKEARLAAEKEVREMKCAHNTPVLLLASSPLTHTYHTACACGANTVRYSFSTLCRPRLALSARRRRNGSPRSASAKRSAWRRNAPMQRRRPSEHHTYTCPAQSSSPPDKPHSFLQ